MNDIMTKVSELTGVSVNDMLSRKRTHEVCEARQIFMYLSRKILGSPHKVTAAFINKTYQSVSSQIIGFDQQIRIYKGLRSKVTSIEREILSNNE